MNKHALSFLLSTLFLSSTLLAVPKTESTTGLQLDAPKRFTLKLNDDGSYTVKKKRSKTKANFLIGTSPLTLQQTADDFVSSSGMNVKKYLEDDDSILLKGKLGKKKKEIRFRKVGDEIEVITYFGKKKKKKKKRSKRSAIVQRLTAAEIRLLDRILRTRQGGRVIPLPVTIPTRQLTGIDGTSALVPNLSGWTFDARDGIVSGGHPTQGIVNLGIPTLVIPPGFFNYGVVSNPVTADVAIATVWPQQAATLGAQIQVLGVQAVPGTSGWLGATYASSGMYTVRFTFNGLTWEALFVSGSALYDAFSNNWLWYHSYIAVPAGGSQAIGNALLNTWATWDNSAASAARLQEALNTVLTTVIPGNPIDPDVFDAIHQQWVDYIRQ